MREWNFRIHVLILSSICFHGGCCAVSILRHFAFWHHLHFLLSSWTPKQENGRSAKMYSIKTPYITHANRGKFTSALGYKFPFVVSYTSGSPKCHCCPKKNIYRKKHKTKLAHWPKPNDNFTERSLKLAFSCKHFISILGTFWNCRFIHHERFTQCEVESAVFEWWEK